MHEFDRVTQVRAAGEGCWHAELAEGWDVFGVPNGGYVLAVLARAFAAETGLPDPLSITAHYLARTAPGPAEIRAHLARKGRRHGAVGAVLRQGERAAVQALATCTDLGAAAGPEWVSAAPPELPPPEECVHARPGAPRDEFAPPPIAGRVTTCVHPDDLGFVRGEPSGAALVRGWIRLPDRVPDTLALVLFADAFPPAVFNVAGLPLNWVPTIELTVHVRARPAPGWIRGVFRTRVVSGGYLEEDGELWDAADRLVAQSRQLAVVPRAEA